MADDMDVAFEWDAAKATANLKNHGVSFEEARTVFGDPLAFVFDDEQHSATEARETLFGLSDSGRLLSISFTEREETIRIISARIMTNRERKDYEDNY